MTQFSYSHSLVAGTPENVNDVQDMFDDIEIAINGNIDHYNLTTGTNQKLGLTDDLTVRRGSSIIATEEARTNVAYGLLTTPDRVQNVVMPAGGLLFIAFMGMWKSSVASAGSAAIFIGANQLQGSTSAAAPIVFSTTSNGAATDTYRPLSSATRGLTSSDSATAYTGDVTTGQILGVDITSTSSSLCVVDNLAAAAYDISIQFKSTSGSVTVKNRRLKVWTMSF